MRTKVLFVLAMVAMVVIGSAAIASNMGFKINIALSAGTANNWVSIPYYNSYTYANTIFSDITGAAQVSRWNNPTSGFQTWTGRGTNFAITAGEAYLQWLATCASQCGAAERQDG